MKTKQIINIVLFSIIIHALTSCNQDNNRNNNNSNDHDTVKLPDKENPLKIEIDKKPEGNYFIGDLINIKISLNE